MRIMVNWSERPGYVCTRSVETVMWIMLKFEHLKKRQLLNLKIMSTIGSLKIQGSRDLTPFLPPPSSSTLPKEDFKNTDLYSLRLLNY